MDYMNKSINLKKKLRSKTFLVSMFSAILLLIQAVGNAFGVDLSVFSDKANEVFNALLTVLVIGGIVVDTGIHAYENNNVEDEE